MASTIRVQRDFKARGSVRRLAGWAIWAILFVPVTILAHESGHFIAATALGYPDVELHFDRIGHGNIGTHPAWYDGVVGLAGPVITVALILLGLAFSRRGDARQWPFALTIAAASRLLVGVPYTLSAIVMAMMGQRLTAPSFDEYKAGVALGLPGDALMALFVSMLFVGIIGVAKTLPQGERWLAWLGLVAGTAVGWWLWMIVLGPRILP